MKKENYILEPKMNTVMKSLILELSKRNITVELMRDNCIVYKRFKKPYDRTDNNLIGFVIVTPYHSVASTYYYLVRATDLPGLTRMNQSKVIDTIVEISQKEV